MRVYCVIQCDIKLFDCCIGVELRLCLFYVLIAKLIDSSRTVLLHFFWFHSVVIIATRLLFGLFICRDHIHLHDMEKNKISFIQTERNPVYIANGSTFRCKSITITNIPSVWFSGGLFRVSRFFLDFFHEGIGE